MGLSDIATAYRCKFRPETLLFIVVKFLLNFSYTKR